LRAEVVTVFVLLVAAVVPFATERMPVGLVAMLRCPRPSLGFNLMWPE
jgi:hypothetical protein